MKNLTNYAGKNKKSNRLMEKVFSIFNSPNTTKYRSNLVFSLESLWVEDFTDYEILSSYDVADSKINIVKDKTGKVYYLISEPFIDKIGKAIYSKIMQFLYVSLPSESKDIQSTRLLFRKQLVDISRKLNLDQYVIPQLDSLVYYVMRDSIGYGIIDVLMKDSSLEDIVEENFAKPVGVVHKGFGEYGILDTNIMFNSIESSNAFVQKLIQRTGKSITAAVPYVDTMTKEGHRIAATFGREVSIPGPNFTIRKFSDKPYTITKLMDFETLSPLMAAYLWLLIESKAFILVIGSTAAGKTTTIGALSTLINPQLKVITIEDTPELRLGHTHWQRLITRKSTSLISEKFEVAMNDLVKLSLRSRPDYIIVGEVRGEEISSLIQAVSTGHGGLTSFHATDAEATLVRMESPPMNVHMGGQMLISVILRQNRLVDPDGKVSRKITEVTEVIPQQNQIKLVNVMGWNTMEHNYYPKNIPELVAKSERLHEVASINGWNKDELIKQIAIRMAYLINMKNNKYFDFEIVTEKLEQFYYKPIEKHLSLLKLESL